MNKAAGKILYKSTINSLNEERLNLIQKVVDFILKEKINLEIDRYELYLILDEAITNAMDHGNRWDKSKKVTLRLEKDLENNLKLYIKDEGIGFNPNIIPEILNRNGKLNPRGRGIYIIRRFCQISWNVTGNEACLTLKTK
ncbi:MAG: ATP-binding protein [Spirochaetia bacterium]|nr:ATP-binding protein [Spirochaetia bacterium]